MTAYRDHRSLCNHRKASHRNNAEFVDGDMLVGPLGDYVRARPDVLAKRVPSPRRVSVLDVLRDAS